MHRTKHLLLFLIFAFNFCWIQSQNNNQQVALITVLDDIKTLHQVTFNYKSGLLKDISVLPISKDLSLMAKLKSLERQTNFVFTKISDVVISITEVITICGYLKDVSQTH